MNKVDEHFLKKENLKKEARKILTDVSLTIDDKIRLFNEVGEKKSCIYNFKDKCLEKIFQYYINSNHYEENEIINVIEDIKAFIGNIIHASTRPNRSYCDYFSDFLVENGFKYKGERSYTTSPELFNRYENILLKKVIKENIKTFKFY